MMGEIRISAMWLLAERKVLSRRMFRIRTAVSGMKPNSNDSAHSCRRVIKLNTIMKGNQQFCLDFCSN